MMRKWMERLIDVNETMAMRWIISKNDRNLKIAIGFSLLLHAMVLSLHFQFPEASRAFQEKALDIILVNSKSARKPSDAQALAQANLDGGGTVEADRRAKTPLPPSELQRSGDDVEQAQQRVQVLETQQRRLLKQLRGKPTPSAAVQNTDQEPQPSPESTLSGRDLVTRSMEMARLQGEIAKQVDEYNKRPRVKNIGTRTEEYRFARYLEDWRIKVERVGTLNYPAAARGKVSGSLTLSVRIKSDGSVERIEITRPSGHRILDDAARRIVRMAEPFAAFPENIRRDTDIIEVTRRWIFTSSNQQLSTQAVR